MKLDKPTSVKERTSKLRNCKTHRDETLCPVLNGCSYYLNATFMFKTLYSNYMMFENIITQAKILY